MPITGSPRTWIEVENPPRVIGGIFSWAKVMDADPHAALAGVEYQTLMCSSIGRYSTPDPFCETKSVTTCAPGGTQVLKTFSVRPTDVQSAPSPVIVMAGMDCIAQGSQEAELRTLLEYTEDRELEKQIQLDVNATGTNLGAAATPEVAIGLLEKWLDENYAGMGVIHMSRQQAVWAASEDLVRPGLDGRLVTTNGTPVVNGRGYYTPPTMMFATGQVILLKHELILKTVPDSMWMEGATVKCAPPRTLAERMWNLLYECGSAFVTGVAP